MLSIYMELKEAREKFVCEWGKLCTEWGVNRTMGQIHAFLLVSEEMECADCIVEALSLSRGNVNMNLRALEDWGLVKKVHKSGDRKDYYQAEKEIAKVFKIIIEQRKKKELDPLLNLMNDICAVKPKCPKSNEFCRMTKEIQQYANKANLALESLTSSKADWIARILIR